MQDKRSPENASGRRSSWLCAGKDGDLLWRYAYRVCQAGDKDSPQAVFERHRLKGAKEQGFSEVLERLRHFWTIRPARNCWPTKPSTPLPCWLTTS